MGYMAFGERCIREEDRIWNRGIPNIASLVNEIFAFVRGSAQGMEIGEVERQSSFPGDGGRESGS